MGIKVFVPAFEIDLDGAFGDDPNLIPEKLKSHYHEFHHFLEENAPKNGVIKIQVNSTQGVFVEWKEA